MSVSQSITGNCESLQAANPGFSYRPISTNRFPLQSSPGRSTDSHPPTRSTKERFGWSTAVSPLSPNTDEHGNS